MVWFVACQKKIVASIYIYIYTYRSLIYAGVIATYSLAAENLYCVESILKLTRIKARIWVFRQLRYTERKGGKGTGNGRQQIGKWGRERSC